MSTKTLSENINQAISDFNSIKQAIIDKGVQVPSGTKTSEYGAKIGEIEGGGGGLDTSGVTNFYQFCYGNRFNDQLDKINTSSGTNFSYMFNSCSKLTTIPQLDTSNGTNFGTMFSSCSNLTTIPQLDTSIGTNFSYMFYGCSNLTTVPQLDTSNGTNFGTMFSYCYKLKSIELTSFIATSRMFDSCTVLENLKITGTITVKNNYLNLSYSTKLTVESLLNVLNALSDNTSLSTTYKITLGSTNLAKLTDEQKQIAINKNYTLA